MSQYNLVNLEHVFDSEYESSIVMIFYLKSNKYDIHSVYTQPCTIFSYLFLTALSSQFLINLRLKYGQFTLTSIRRCEILIKKLQKAKCDTEFLGVV